MDYDKIVSNPQATRYVVNFMHRTSLLQQFQHVGIEEDDNDDEPTGLAAIDLARVDNHANQLAKTTSPSIETEAGEGLQREREGERERERKRSEREVREKEK
ncbi:hypothetical protein ACN42_g11649 [Penicillium freii]|uniref:Uncharacterized protein n=1 Tax=Penicillium freii TaxID=48697 RepID=A0A101M7U0_PENFR|nr:hypothetical protein ACN42_g11649 [Penicillium freii]